MAPGSGRVLGVALLAAATVPACPALAQGQLDPEPADVAPVYNVPVSTARDIYYPADFASFGPRTALDMVRQIPGFTVDDRGSGSQSRGLGQANGNVLLNGVRIVTKSDSITDQLARIAADRVIRIELVDGSTLNIPGLSGRVANVIASSSDGLQGQFEWRPQLPAEYADMRWLEGIVSVSGTSGGLDFTLAAEGRPVRNGNGGINTFTYGDGSQIQRFSETNSHGDDKRLSGSLRYETAGGTLLNLNSSYLLRRFYLFDDERVIAPASAPPLTDRLDQNNRGHDFELGGDLDFALGSGRLKLIGLNSTRTLGATTVSVIDPATGDPALGSRYVQVSDSSERIGRGEYTWSMLGADWQWSVEAAFNALDQTGDLALLDPNGIFQPVPFPSGNGGVREDRYESLLSFSRQLTDSLSLQLIAGGEYSSIRQTGVDANSRTFLRPKGTLNLAWTPQQGLDISLRLERRVGQLNFSDFLAAVNLGSNNQNASNNELRPDQSWGLSIEGTRDFGAWGSATLRLWTRRWEDYITIVPTSTGGEARGNVDHALAYGTELHGTLRLDPLGLAGAKFDFNGTLRHSSFPDPVVAGAHLPISFLDPHNVEIDFRYDIPASDWAFGSGFRDTGHNPYYRVRESGYDYAIDRNLSLFIENKDVFGLTVQARVSNLLESEAVLDRQIFTGPRGSSPLAFREQRIREVGRVVNFTIKGSF
ncbi:MAG: TonB-dependent receptor plug domain-containing protein [Erythrobacter sp.]|nr:TonB-dependent receptor plug domain-containing protein [Erythrobacter sp.]